MVAVGYTSTAPSSGGGGGDATAANQATGNASLGSIDTKTLAAGQAAMAASTPVVVASNQSAIPVSAASLPLPADAATQTTLAALNTKVTAVDTGAVTVAGSALPSGAATAANQSTANASLSSVDGKLGALGQAAMAASAPVVIASNQSAVPVSGTVTANIGTAGTLALDASVTGLQVAQGSTTSGQKGGLAAGAVTTAAPAYTTAQTSPLSLTTGGSLRTARVESTVSAVALTGADQAVSASATTYHGFTIRETAGAAAVVVIYDHGSAASGTMLEQISLAAGESRAEYYDGGVKAAAGIYVDIVSGTVAGSIRKAA